MSETAQSESRSEDSAAGKTDGEIKAIAAETEIAAIEEGGKQGTGEVGNPADRRLPLIVRIYGIVMLIEGVVTLPIIVLSCLYVVQAVLSGDMTFDALSLTTILSAIHAVVLMVTTACPDGVRRAAFQEQTPAHRAMDVPADSAYARRRPAVAGVEGAWPEPCQPGCPACRADRPAHHRRPIAAGGAPAAVRVAAHGRPQRV